MLDSREQEFPEKIRIMLMWICWITRNKDLPKKIWTMFCE